LADLVVGNDALALVAVLALLTTADELPRRLRVLVQWIYPAGALWIPWPKRAGGHHRDITENLVRERALPLSGVVDVKVVAIDDDWSGKRFVWPYVSGSGEASGSEQIRRLM